MYICNNMSSHFRYSYTCRCISDSSDTFYFGKVNRKHIRVFTEGVSYKPANTATWYISYSGIHTIGMITHSSWRARNHRSQRDAHHTSTSGHLRHTGGGARGRGEGRCGECQMWGWRRCLARRWQRWLASGRWHPGGPRAGRALAASVRTLPSRAWKGGDVELVWFGWIEGLAEAWLSGSRATDEVFIILSTIYVYELWRQSLWSLQV